MRKIRSKTTAMSGVDNPDVRAEIWNQCWNTRRIPFALRARHVCFAVACAFVIAVSTHWLARGSSLSAWLAPAVGIVAGFGLSEILRYRWGGKPATRCS